MFREIEKIVKVTAADVKRVAAESFTQNYRTVAKLESTPKNTAAPKGGAQ